MPLTGIELHSHCESLESVIGHDLQLLQSEERQRQLHTARSAAILPESWLRQQSSRHAELQHFGEIKQWDRPLDVASRLLSRDEVPNPSSKNQQVRLNIANTAHRKHFCAWLRKMHQLNLAHCG
jgi:hypothetical protein